MVIAIIGVLIGLLLPAVQKISRGGQPDGLLQEQPEADRAGMPHVSRHERHVSSRVLSTQATIHGDHGPKSREHVVSWSALILPYIEQGNLYQQLNPTRDKLRNIVYNPANRALVQTKIKTYICPSDDGPSPNVNRPLFGGAGTGTDGFNLDGFQFGTSNYCGNNGHTNGVGIFVDNNGTPHFSTPVSIPNITDGTSNTLMVGERTSSVVLSGKDSGGTPCSPIPPVPRGAAVWVGYQGWAPGVNGPVPNPQFSAANLPQANIWGFLITHLYEENTGDSFTGCTLNQPGQSPSSQHPGGVQYCLCDGSVTFIKNDINWTATGNKDRAGNTLPIMGTLNRLAQKDDGLPVGDY